MQNSLLIGLSALALLTHTSAHAVELPVRKPGLWEMKMQPSPQMPAMTMQHCTDETFDKQMTATFSPMAKDNCSKSEIQQTATGYVTDSVCTVAGVTSTTHAEITGDFNAAYTVTVTTQAQGAAARKDALTVEATYLGACKAGQKPGDVVMPGGLKMNIKDLEKAKSLMPK